MCPCSCQSSSSFQLLEVPHPTRIDLLEGSTGALRKCPSKGQGTCRQSQITSGRAGVLQ